VSRALGGTLVAEQRTPEQYTKQVETYLEEVQEVYQARASDEFLDHPASVLRLRVKNETDRPFNAVLRNLAPDWPPYQTLNGTQLHDQLTEPGVKVVKTKNLPSLDPPELRRVLAARATADLDAP
jgi:hypothetical protein